MASLRILKRRIRSTQSTQQVMRAMQLVSGSKFKRSQSRLLEARAVLEFLDGLLQRVLAVTPTLDHPLRTSREGGESALVLFTSDAGLCGAYNANLIHLAEAHLRRPFDSAQDAVPSHVEGRRDGPTITHLIFIGKKGHRDFTKRGYAAAETYLDLAGRPNLERIEAIGRSLMERFLSGRVSAINLLSSRFVSPTVHRPTIRQWLPIQLVGRKHTTTSFTEEPTSLRAYEPKQRPTDAYIFEPSAQRVFEALLPRWALATFQAIMLEAFTSEHSARMIAMKNATDNAEELIQELTLLRNQVRQAAITKELSEIVGTAEALK